MFIGMNVLYVVDVYVVLCNSEKKNIDTCRKSVAGVHGCPTRCFFPHCHMTFVTLNDGSWENIFTGARGNKN
jgi:hypothetical protein